jgi:hypothetical protein
MLIFDDFTMRSMRNDILATNSGDKYWLDELRSLGISPDRTNEFNDEKELGNLAEILKQAMLQDYGTACSEKAKSTSRKQKLR